ncbi:hypothetical protein CYLTODRAFT_407233 [Cylindrobasidium torrendii FP15055 ss-10]|uniref:Uncharacterized protein n=1 Tax=Cylindrobasidium torrendii FP15055 ss-10 TaxID=1314674 RepID=A0A0D7BQL5_9AGAR|nr:hypothetical protein CYLTODRAFT_407233 [Cylindrobasidium torrendii FP15055 ss-10]
MLVLVTMMCAEKPYEKCATAQRDEQYIERMRRFGSRVGAVSSEGETAKAAVMDNFYYPSIIEWIVMPISIHFQHTNTGFSYAGTETATWAIIAAKTYNYNGMQEAHSYSTKPRFLAPTYTERGKLRHNFPPMAVPRHPIPGNLRLCCGVTISQKKRHKRDPDSKLSVSRITGGHLIRNEHESRFPTIPRFSTLLPQQSAGLRARFRRRRNGEWHKKRESDTACRLPLKLDGGNHR